MRATNAWLYVRHPRFAAIYHDRLGSWPDLAAPSQLSEMVQWRKLFDRNPLLPRLSDKLLAKQWAHERCPDLPSAETVWVGSRPQDVPTELLAPGYVVKTNHGSTNNYFPDREPLSRPAFNARFDDWLSQSRAKELEWAYGPIARQVFVERFIDAHGAPMIDISFRAFDGELGAASVATDYKTEHAKWSYFDLDGSRLELQQEALRDDALPPGFEVPPTLRRAGGFARRLSRGFDYVRVDFLSVGDALYFSEMTFYPAAGYGPDGPVAKDNFRRWVRGMDKSWFLTTQHRPPLSIYAGAFRRWMEELAAESGA
ncbi:MAG: ATP-grasp fold amidoligase family protein [Devosia sp.]|nr:ATP-grasp fold amidoligase family protein [Devosia sp.]